MCLWHVAVIRLRGPVTVEDVGEITPYFAPCVRSANKPWTVSRTSVWNAISRGSSSASHPRRGAGRESRALNSRIINTQPPCFKIIHKVFMNAVIAVFFSSSGTFLYCATLVQNLFISITCWKQFSVLHSNDDVDRCLMNPCVVTRRNGWTETQPLQKKRKKIGCILARGASPLPWWPLTPFQMSAAILHCV